MTRISLLLVIASAFLLLLSCKQTSEKLAEPESNGQMLVAFKADITNEQISTLLSSVKSGVLQKITDDGTYLIQAKSPEDIDVILKQLNSSELVRYAEPNHTMKKSK